MTVLSDLQSEYDVNDRHIITNPGNFEGGLNMHGAQQKDMPMSHSLLNKRIEIPVHYDLWMRGARFGTVTSYRQGKPGLSACILVKMDHPQVRRRLKVWALDWDYCKVL